MLKFFLSINYVDFQQIKEDGSMKANYRVDHIPKSTPYNRRPGIKLDATTITIHNTANPSSTARNERLWLTNPANTRTASYHIVVDDKEAIEVIPLNEVAWHAGDGNSRSSGNRTSIGIEICESGNYEQTINNAADLVATLLLERGWDTNQLRRHFDWSGKNCPRLMNTSGDWSGWKEFVAKVENVLKQKKLELETRDLDNDEHTVIEEDEGEVTMTVEDANKIIRFLSAAYMATNSKEARNEFNRLANELRKASGQEPISG